MRIFKIKKGGKTENPEEAVVILTRDVDGELLTKAVNICADKEMNVQQTIYYLKEQFDCIEFATFDDLFTFYC